MTLNSAIHQRPDQAAFMWRTSRSKLILVMNRKKAAADYHESDIVDGELYDLAQDPMEWEDLYKKPNTRAIRDKMTDELLTHLATL